MTSRHVRRGQPQRSTGLSDSYAKCTEIQIQLAILEERSNSADRQIDLLAQSSGKFQDTAGARLIAMDSRLNEMGYHLKNCISGIGDNRERIKALETSLSSSQSLFVDQVIKWGPLLLALAASAIAWLKGSMPVP